MTHEEITASRLGKLQIELIKLEAALYAQAAKIKELEQDKIAAEARIADLMNKLTSRGDDGQGD